jgi:TPR repeat protein
MSIPLRVLLKTPKIVEALQHLVSIATCRTFPFARHLFMKKTDCTLALALCFGLIGPAPAQHTTTAEVIDDRFATTFRETRVAADRGVASAQYNLGVMYENGMGVAKDSAQAVIWYRKAADQGLAQAQTNLGAMYENGIGVAKDSAQAVAWYRKAADQGDLQAQHNLGMMYTFGQGVEKNEAQAVEWLRRAADRGLAQAQSALRQIEKGGRMDREFSL